MYGSGKATKPKNIGVKHIQQWQVSPLEKFGITWAYLEETRGDSIMDKLHNQKANEVKEDLK